MQPVSLIKTTVAILFTSFIIFGLLVSFFLGRKMYSPIKMIRDKLYGQAAIRHEDFISASSSSNELEYIDKWYTEIINDFKNMNQKIDEMRPTIVEHTLLRIIKGQINDFEVVNNYMDSSNRIEPVFNKLLMVIECIFPDELRKEISVKDKGLYKRKLKGLISNIDEKIFTIDVNENNIALLWVLQDKPCDVQYYTGLIMQVLDTIETASVKHVLAVHEEFINTEEQTADAFEICTKLLDYRLLTKENEVITENDMEKRIYGDTCLSEDNVIQLRSKKSSEEITACILDILDFYYCTTKVERNIKQISVDILNVIMRTSVNPSKPNLEKIVEYTTLIGKCHTLSEIKMLFENICKHINLHTEIHEAENPGAVIQESAIQEVMEYIKENYNKDLSLEYFAEKYNISVGHFSRCFKNYSGYKYVDYVNHCRLDRAKILLIETDMLISEISEEVGYIGKNTFNATFKRYEGITPGRYRIDYRKQKNISIKAEYKTSNSSC